MPRTTALIFAKYPTPGAVKTRMVPPLTPEEAAELHATSLAAVCERVARFAGPQTDPVLVVTPDDRAVDLQTLVGGVDACWPQRDGDLGSRLTRACDRAFAEGSEAVMLFGADSPTIPSSLLNEAVAELAGHDAVLGPCDDGGYYLLALRKPLPALFERIDWGSERVCNQTRQRGQDAGVALHELGSWYDLDRFEDLARARRDLAPLDGQAMPAGAALRRLIDTYLERYA